MIAFLNGRFVPAERARISASDRGFLYGDGLFETVRVHDGRPFLLERHLERLGRGAAFLQLPLPLTVGELDSIARKLIERNRTREGVLRLNLSRGAGPRGFSARGATHPTVVGSVHPAPAFAAGHPQRWRVVTSGVRVAAGDPMARFKTTNKLTHVLARMDAEAADADEALMLNTAGRVAEGAGANVFWLHGSSVFTPSIECGALPGVTRGLLLELCRRLGIEVQERKARLDEVARADAAFLTLSSLGIVEVASLDGRKFKRSPVVRRLWKSYVDALCGR